MDRIFKCLSKRWVTMSRVFQYTEKIFDIILFIFGLLMVLFMFVQIISRIFFEHSFQWIEEFARLGMVWTTFLGAALLVKTRDHTKVEFFIGLLPEKLNKIVNVALNIIITIFLFILLKHSVSAIEQAMMQTTPGLKIPYGITMISILVSGIFMILFLIYDSVNWIKERSNE